MRAGIVMFSNNVTLYFVSLTSIGEYFAALSKQEERCSLLGGDPALPKHCWVGRQREGSYIGDDKTKLWRLTLTSHRQVRGLGPQQRVLVGQRRRATDGESTSGQRSALHGSFLPVNSWARLIVEQMASQFRTVEKQTVCKNHI